MSQVSRCRRESGQAYLLFYDLQKAFDSVRRDDLYSIMSKRGLPPELIQATKLLNTNQAMKIENLMMPWIPMSKGVRQGSSLSPLLFTTFLTLIEIEKLEKLCNAKIRLYADDIVIICPSAEKAKEVDDYLKKTFARFGLSINYAPGKSCYMQTSQAKNKYTTKIGDLERVESYQYLGCLLSLDKRNSISYRGLTKTQSTNRNSKIKQIAKKFSWMLGNRKTTAADVNNLILSLTRGNQYGVINPHTNLNFDFRTKGSAHIQKWETALRGLIMDSYELPIWTKSDLLHTLTGVPHFRIILLQEAISKIKRWRTLIGNGSPLSKPEIKDLKDYLNGSTLVTKVSSFLKIENPLLETTDWKSVEIAIRAHIRSYWKAIRDSTPNIGQNQRGGWFLSEVGFQGWKLHCQTTVSIHCIKPEGTHNSPRTKCPVCYEHHKNFKTCLKQAGYYKKNKVNTRLATIILTLKKRNSKDLLNQVKSHVNNDNEWFNIPNMPKERDRRTSKPRSDTV